MTACVDECPLEARQRDDRSPGIVDPEEFVVRASYDPRHYKKNKVQPSVIKATDLFNGTLSVWRVSGKAKMALSDLSKKLQAECQPGQTVKALHPLPVAQIRAMRTEDETNRLFCVVDECETDDNGGYHSAHAHIRICDRLRSSMNDTANELFVHIKRALFDAIKLNQAVP